MYVCVVPEQSLSLIGAHTEKRPSHRVVSLLSPSFGHPDGGSPAMYLISEKVGISSRRRPQPVSRLKNLPKKQCRTTRRNTHSCLRLLYRSQGRGRPSLSHACADALQRLRWPLLHDSCLIALLEDRRQHQPLSAKLTQKFQHSRCRVCRYTPPLGHRRRNATDVACVLWLAPFNPSRVVVKI